MTYPNSFIKITFGGKIYGDADIWSNSLSVGNPTGPANVGPFKDSQTAKDAVITAIRSWFTRGDTGISTGATLEWVKFAQVGADGFYTVAADGDYAFNETHDITPVAGAMSLNVAPQLSLAITLDTGAKRGLAKTGRIYPPLTGELNAAGVDNSPQLKAASAATMISAINAAFANTNPEGGVHDQVVVASGVREGKIALVQSVRVGNVVDTQRRRRNNITEVYSPADITVYPESADNYGLAA